MTKEKEQPDSPLVNDLHRVLQYELLFSDAFAMSKVIPGCPNPGLDVDGVGRVPLPLTDHTAGLIASVGDQAPYGRGTETVIDTTIRDTIQIDASSVRFMNPKWTTTIQEWVENEVWDGLGCAPFSSPPRCELYKLLLYKPGAHFLPHRDTEKAAGMFATLVVVLPSEFTGGEIHLSHGDKNMVFNGAEDSAFETTSLAWYTDVTHEVKEITSGHRLALSYHLINTSPGISPPHLPSDHSSLQHLREIFSRWSKDEYPELEVSPAVAYVFTHEYTEESLNATIFKGEDQRVASILKDVGDTEGIMVLMGWFNARVKGYTGDDGWETFDPLHGEPAPEYGPLKGTQEIPVMSSVSKTNFWVEGLRDVQGKETGITKIKVGDGSVLPFRALRGLAPDDATLEDECWGNQGASVEFMYELVALVIFPRREQVRLMFLSEGPDWALEELEKSKFEGASKENVEIIELLAEQKDDGIAGTISKVAIEWNHPVAWGFVVESHPGFFLKQKEYAGLWDGWQAFGFDGVRSTFEKLVPRCDSLPAETMGFLLFVKKKLGFEKEGEWMRAQAARAMEAFTPSRVGDREKTKVIELVRWQGLQFASSSVLPRFLGKRAFPEDLTGLALGLIEYKKELIELPVVEGQRTSNVELLGEILDELVGAATERVSWSYGPELEAQVTSLLSICIAENRARAYGKVLEGMRSSGESGGRFHDRYVGFHEEVIPTMVGMLKKHGVKASSSPTREFLCGVVGKYLEEMLGSKELGSPYLKMPAVTCGHEGCGEVEEFLLSGESRMRIPVSKWDKVRGCVVDLKIGGRHEALEIERLLRDEPGYVELRKTRAAEVGQDWRVRLVEAEKLVKCIGEGEEEISEIMGERYSDVEKALEGSQAFVMIEEDEMVGIE